jgi:hypothetical protein
MILLQIDKQRSNLAVAAYLQNKQNRAVTGHRASLEIGNACGEAQLWR